MKMETATSIIFEQHVLTKLDSIQIEPTIREVQSDLKKQDI
jgi:hypothetical protein